MRTDKRGERLVTVAVFNTAVRAHLARIKLECEGIESIVIDEFAGDLSYGLPGGGVKLQVRRSDLERAKGILWVAPEEEEDNPPCPFCDSTDVKFGRLPGRLRYALPKLLIWLPLLEFPLILGSQKWFCNNCGHEWEEE